MEQPLTLHSWPKAILHVDCDAFFASCEQAIHPELKGKPVITGKERGIVSAASYEAKNKGVERGMRLFEAKKICPDAIFCPSDYETYSLFSVRMFEILKRFSPQIEEYSIDEAFVDLTGFRRTFHTSYENIAEKIQETIIRELDISVTVGLSTTKVLAKIASKHKKPRGLTCIPGKEIHLYLENLPVKKIWGIGKNTSEFLNKHGIKTALDFAKANENFIQKHLSKPFKEIWHELNGRSVYKVADHDKSSYQSICKSRTFTPPSSDKTFILGQLAKNLENACIKARRYKLAAKRIIIFLRKQDFKETGVEIKLNRASAYPMELVHSIQKAFDQLFNARFLYRTTSVVLAGLISENRVQYTIFDNTTKIQKLSRLYHAVDTISKKFGKHTVSIGTSAPAKLQDQHEGERGDIPSRKKDLFAGENERQRLGMPILNVRV